MHVAAVATALALALAPVRSSELPKAREHFDRATEAFDRGDYDIAVTELQAGYALQPDPAALYAWGQAERMRGNCPRAIELYNVFLASDPPPDAVAKTRSHIELCEEQLRLDENADDASADDASAQEPPVPPPRVVVVDTSPTPAPDRRLDRTGMALLGVGAGLAAVGIPLLGVAIYRAPRVEDGSERELVSRRGSVRAMYTAGWVVVGLAAASLLGGVIRLMVARKAPRRR